MPRISSSRFAAEQSGPQTVLWLNEAQVFLRGQPDVAVALRRLLAGDEPVVVIGTMWPEFWKELTSAPDDDAPDVNHQTRELLLHDADRVDVPEAFTGRDRAQLGRVVTTDPRLAAAVAAAERDGKVVQVLAGGPSSCSATTIRPMPRTGSARRW